MWTFSLDFKFWILAKINGGDNLTRLLKILTLDSANINPQNKKPTSKKRPMVNLLEYVNPDIQNPSLKQPMLGLQSIAKPKFSLSVSIVISILFFVIAWSLQM